MLRALPRDEALRRAASTPRRDAPLRHVLALARRAAVPPRARSGCTSAARPSTRGRTSATRARSSSACGCAPGCARRGYEAMLVHNITDVNDKIYDAAPGASAELAERATGWYLEDTGDLGLGLPDHLPKATESVPQIVAFIEELVAAGHAYAVDGDVYFRVASVPRVRPAVRPAPRPGRGAGAEPAQGGRPRLRALEGEQAGTEDTWWDSPWGRGRPGWHIECSAMAEEVFGPVVRDPRRRPRPRLPAPRERGRAVAGARPSVRRRSGRTTGCSGSPARRCRSRSATSTTLREALDEWGRETLLVFFLGGHWRKPIDFSRRDAGAGGGTARDAAKRVHAAGGRRARRGRLGAVRRGARRRLRHAAGARRAARVGLRRAARAAAARPRRSSASGSLAERERRPRRRWRSSPSAAQQARSSRDSRPPTRLRDELAGLGWEMRDEPGGGFTCSSAASVTRRSRLRAPRRSRGAPRPARGARACGRPSGRSRPSRGSPRRSRR